MDAKPVLMIIVENGRRETMKCPYRKNIVLIKTEKTEETRETYEECYKNECPLYTESCNGCLRVESIKK